MNDKKNVFQAVETIKWSPDPRPCDSFSYHTCPIIFVDITGGRSILEKSPLFKNFQAVKVGKMKD